MGDLIPFRRPKRKWTKPEDYGKVLPTSRWRGKPGRRRNRWSPWKPWIGLILLLATWQVAKTYWLTEPPLKGTRQAVSTQFHRCGQGKGPNCVVDGDTFIMAQRHIRITGIDAPEIGAKARCPVEAAKAEVAANELLRLLNQGVFTMQSSQDGLRDEYGRELMTVTRPGPPVQDIAKDLIASGTVRRYEYGARQTWC
jgi:micrococcal nuclease